MPIAAGDVILIGTNETTGVTLTNNSTNQTANVDILGDDLSDGLFWLFVAFTGGAAAGTVDVTFQPQRTTSNLYVPQLLTVQIVPIVGALSLPFGPYPCPRYGAFSVKNNATTASLTNLFLAIRKVVYK